MNTTLQIFFIVAILIFFTIIVRFLALKKLDLKYSLVWLAACSGMLILVMFPDLVDQLGKLVGIATPVSTVFVFAGMFMMLIIFTLTVIVSRMTNRIYRLTQIIAILEKRVRELNAKEIE